MNTQDEDGYERDATRRKATRRKGTRASLNRGSQCSTDGGSAEGPVTQNTGLIEQVSVRAVITPRRSSGRTSRNRETQEDNGVMRETLKGRELDALLTRADERGVYKRFLVLGWLIPACLVVPCAYLNILLMVYVPSFNCTLPTPPSHLSYSNWRSFVTPKTPAGDLNPCALYDFPSALKDPLYNPGIHTQYNARVSTHIVSSTHEPPAPTQHPNPLHPTNTPGENTGDFEDPPGNASQASPPEDTGTTGLGGITGITERIPLFSKHPVTLEGHPSSEEHPSTSQHSSIIPGHTSKGKRINPGPESTHNLHITQENTGEYQHLSTQELSFITSEDPPAEDQELSTEERPPSTPADQQGSTHDPHVPKSRVARYFNPFDDLYDPKNEEGHRTHSEPKDPRDEYREAAMLWRRHYPKEAPPDNHTIGCVFGYDFDKTYVQESMSMQFGWVCDASEGITRILHVSMAGNVVGSIFFGVLADRVGRKWVFLLVAVKGAILGSLFVLVRGIWSHLIVRFLLSLGLPAVYQIIIITGLEQVRAKERGLVTSLSSVCFSLGQSLLGLLAWLTGNWFTLGLVTSLPCILALVYTRLLEESPQWLVSRGRELEAATVLKRITMRNRSKNQPVPSLTLLRLRIRDITTTGSEEEEHRGIISEGICGRWCGYVVRIAVFLASYPYLSFRAVLITICWIVNLILYFITTMKYPNVTSNPYLAWFFTSIMEVPANLIMPLLLRYIGRRTLHSCGLLLCSLAFFTASGLLAAGYKENFVGISALLLGAKFCGCMTYLVLYLQASELNPTPIRSCVVGVASLVGLSVNIMSPSILSWESPFSSYLLLALLGLLGAVSAFLLPETAGRPLPQTLQEAENFTWRGNTALLIPGQVEVNRGVDERLILTDITVTPPTPPTPPPSRTSPGQTSVPSPPTPHPSRSFPGQTSPPTPPTPPPSSTPPGQTSASSPDSVREETEL